MLVSDMLTSFVKYSVDRKSLGESSGRYQYELFKYTQTFLNQYLSPEAFATDSKVSVLISQIEECLLKVHSSYEDFLHELKPLLEKIDFEVAKYSSAKNAFIPPHCFFIRALEFKLEGKAKGLVGLRYFGHGIHKSLI